MRVLDVAHGVVQQSIALRRGRFADGQRCPPGPRADPVIGHYRWLQADRLRFFTKAFVEHGDIVRFHFLALGATLAAHPDHVEHPDA